MFVWNIGFNDPSLLIITIIGLTPNLLEAESPNAGTNENKTPIRNAKSKSNGSNTNYY